MGCFELECCCGFGWLRVCHSSLRAQIFLGLQRKTLDPGFRRDDSFKAGGLKAVIPAQGVAGVSDRMRSARVTALAYMPVRAVQGGIQRLNTLFRGDNF